MLEFDLSLNNKLGLLGQAIPEACGDDSDIEASLQAFGAISYHIFTY
jgi:hypothetical protein